MLLESLAVASTIMQMAQMANQFKQQKDAEAESEKADIDSRTASILRGTKQRGYQGGGGGGAQDRSMQALQVLQGLTGAGQTMAGAFGKPSTQAAQAGDAQTIQNWNSNRILGQRSNFIPPDGWRARPGSTLASSLK